MNERYRIGPHHFARQMVTSRSLCQTNSTRFFLRLKYCTKNIFFNENIKSEPNYIINYRNNSLNRNFDVIGKPFRQRCFQPQFSNNRCSFILFQVLARPVLVLEDC